MNKRAAAVCVLICALLLAASRPAPCLETIESYSTTDLKVNWGYLIEELLVDKLYSHGCLHVSPQLARLIYEIIPPGAEIEIKEYSEDAPVEAAAVPHLLNCIVSAETLEQARRAFARPEKLRLAAYPGPGKALIYFRDRPYAWFGFRPGFAKTALMFLGYQGRTAVYDKYYLTRTVPGKFWFSYYTTYLKASYYPLTTSLPYGEKMLRRPNGWVYFKDGRETAVPREIALDVQKQAGERLYEYFNEIKDGQGSLVSVRWGNHDYGTYVTGFSDERSVLNQDLIYAPGLLINIQRRLIGHLVSLILADSDDLVALVQGIEELRRDLLFYNYHQNPTASKYIQKTQEEREYYAYYKFYRGLPLDSWEREDIQPYYFAVKKYLDQGPSRLTRPEADSLIGAGAAVRQGDRIVYDEKKIRGLDYHLEEIGLTVVNGARRWETLKKDWPLLLTYRKVMRRKFGQDKTALGRVILDEINDRLEFKNLL